jgi:hypothetical protein
MSLLPTVTDVALKIASLDNNIIVRIKDEKTGNSTDYTPYGATNCLNCYSMEVVSVSKKAIVMAFQSGNQVTVTFHKTVMTQIGIEAL